MSWVRLFGPGGGHGQWDLRDGKYDKEDSLN